MNKIILAGCIAVSVVAVATCTVVCFNVFSTPSNLSTTIPLSSTSAEEVTQPDTQSESEDNTSGFKLLRNSVSKISLMSADEYIEEIYPFNSYHPKVLDLGEEGWNGYRYWVSYTPYPSGFDYYENPHVVATNDFINYSNILHFEQPLENYEKSVRFNSDSCIVYNDDLNRLELIWRYTDYESDYMALYMRSSEDGTNWSESEIFYETYYRDSYDMVSPAIIYEDGTYKAWYVSEYGIYYRERVDGEWSDSVETEIKYEDGAHTWHIDVIKTEKGYELLACGLDDFYDRKHMNLYYASSQDGMDWGTAEAILFPSQDSYNWDGGGLYKSTFVYSDGLYYVLYSGRNDYNDIGVGFLFGKDMHNLFGTDMDYINDGLNSSAQFWKFIEEYKNFTSDTT